MSTLAARIPPEVLHLMFSDLDAKSLFKCAQTCRYWSETAVDLLWKDLPEVSPLLRLLGDVSVDEHEVPDWHVLVIHEYECSDWERLHSYGRRVRSLTHKEWDEVQTDDPHAPPMKATILLEDILILSAGIPHSFLPHLKEIHWGVELSCSSLLSILPFVGSSLKVLDIELRCSVEDGDCRAAGKILRVIGNRADIQIERFRWHVEPVHAPGGEDIEAALADFFLLQRKWLKEIDISYACSWFTGGTIGRSERIDEGWDASVLTSVKITSYDYTVDWQPFLRMTSLKTFSFEFQSMPSLGELNISKMGAAWPNVQRLELIEITGDLQDLAAFAIHMPGLKELSFQLVLGETRIPERIVPFQRLQMLDIGWTDIMRGESNVTRHTAVITVLSKLCSPNVKIRVNKDLWRNESGDVFDMEAEEDTEFSADEDGQQETEEESDDDSDVSFYWWRIKNGLRKAHRGSTTRSTPIVIPKS